MKRAGVSHHPASRGPWNGERHQICGDERLWAAGRGQQQDRQGQVRKRPSNGVSESRQHPVSYLAGMPHNFAYYQRAPNHRESQRMALCINFISQDSPAWLSICFQHDPVFYLISQLDARSRERLSDLPMRPQCGCFLQGWCLGGCFRASSTVILQQGSGETVRLEARPTWVLQSPLNRKHSFSWSPSDSVSKSLGVKWHLAHQTTERP